MKLRSAIFLLVLGLAVAAPSAKAETGADLRSACRQLSVAPVNGDQITMPTDFASGECWGFFVLFQDMAVLIDADTNRPMFAMCVPADSRRSQLIAVFEKYADDHPEDLNKDAVWLATDAMRHAWPCKSKIRKR